MTAQPNYAVATGEFISEWMDEREINAAELSRRLSVSRKHVSQLLSGKASLSQELALALERVTGVNARIWNQYESLYREDLARLAADSALAEQLDQAKEYPLAWLRKLGVIGASPHDKAGTVRELLILFRVADMAALRETWAHGTVAYRKAAACRDDAQALTTWLTVGEREVDIEILPDYDASRLRACLTDIRALTRASPERVLDDATHILAGAGVALTLVPSIPGLGIYGATRWINGHPVVQLSPLRKTDDQFWFTLFHELGHVLFHSHLGLYLANDDDTVEEEANAFAMRTLIPPEHAGRLPRGRDIEAVCELASEIGVSPGVVLGQAQHLTGDFSWGHRLKVRIEFGPLRQVGS